MGNWANTGHIDHVTLRPQSLTLEVMAHVAFDLETSMRVVSKVGNLPSKFGHTRPLGATDGRTDRPTDDRLDRQQQRLLPQFPTGKGITINIL